MKLIQYFVTATALFLISLPTFARTQLSADVSGSDIGDNFKGKVRMYLGENFSKLEGKNSNGVNSATIEDVKARKVYMLDLDHKTYIEFPTDQAFSMYTVDVKSICENPAVKDVKCKKEGSQDMNGKKMDKYSITRLGKKYTALVDPSDGVVRRYMTSNGEVSMELTNVKLGSQPDSLFKVPSGFKNLED